MHGNILVFGFKVFFFYEMSLLAHCTSQGCGSAEVSEPCGEILTPYSWVINTILVDCGEKWAKSLQLVLCWICCLSSALKTTWVLTPFTKIVGLLNPECQGPWSVSSRRTGLLWKIRWEINHSMFKANIQGFAFVCASWDPLASEVSFSFCLYITFLKAWNGNCRDCQWLLKYQFRITVIRQKYCPSSKCCFLFTSFEMFSFRSTGKSKGKLPQYFHKFTKA